MTISGAEIPTIPDVFIKDAEIRNILLAIKQIIEIRNNRRSGQDANQRFITYYELINYLRGEDQLTIVAVEGGHNHDTLYAVISHNHDSDYAKTVDVEGVYALVVHGHDGVYEPIGPRSWKKITANGVTLGGGPPTSPDSVSDLQTPHDGNTYTVSEIASNPGQNLVVDFADVPRFSMVQILMRVNEQSGHSLTIQLEVSPFDGSAWHTYDTVVDQVADQNFENHDIFIPNSEAYINSGVVKVGIVHEMNGNAVDTWIIDTVGLYHQ
jgi:hypothetical protein